MINYVSKVMGRVMCVKTDLAEACFEWVSGGTNG